MAVEDGPLGAAHSPPVQSLRPSRPPLTPVALDTAAKPQPDQLLPGAASAATSTSAIASAAANPPSPKAERLPSFRHISKIADAAADDEATRGALPYHIPPATTHQPYPQVVQKSPSSTAALHLPHQSSSATHPPEPAVPIVPLPSAFAYPYNSRRIEPIPTGHFSAPPALRTMPTNSSSGESYSHHSSIGEISTSHTTPIEYTGPVDAHGGPKFPVPAAVLQDPAQQAPTGLMQLPLPPIPLVHSLLPPPAPAGPWLCEHPGCNAAPFPTQYLLNSHSTSHSPHRPHYCSVPGCPRGVGGKGFKRKNEMIRHGLTHSTPGYVCPFCPDRSGHRYPRPDNLQRHVRVHHVDKDRDDPLLREVLSQRIPAGPNTAAGGAVNGPGNGSRGRRRRAATSSAGSTPQAVPVADPSALDRSETA